MNTLEIKLSNKNALEKTNPMMTSIELFLARKGVFPTKEELVELQEDIASYFTRINLIIKD